MSSINPALWFQSEAEDAANFYVSIFPNSRIGHVMRGGPAVIAVEFTIDGAPVLAINGRQENGFTDAHSFVVSCGSQDEIDRYWTALTSNGGEEGQCGWCKDRFGVSWQVVPRNMAELLGGNPAAIQAMMGMKKLDIAALRKARTSAP